jgi:hypothetical protein
MLAALREHRRRGLSAAAASGSDSGAIREIRERAGTIAGAPPNIVLGDGVAEADVHG